MTKGALRGETGLVDAIVDVVVSPFVGLFNLLPEMFWKEIDFRVLLWEYVIKFGVEHPYDFA